MRHKLIPLRILALVAWILVHGLFIVLTLEA